MRRYSQRTSRKCRLRFPMGSRQCKVPTQPLESFRQRDVASL